jgi:acyl dehydratase
MAIERFPVEASHILMFARAIGDDNPVYRDADAAAKGETEGIVAPPTFVQAGAQFDPTYRLRPQPGVTWFGSGKLPSGLQRPKPDAAPGSDAPAPRGGGGGLHAEQHYEYHRPLRPGDVLTTKSRAGKTWEKESKRAGKLKFSEQITDYYDQHGQLVITARAVGMTTERVIDNG